MIEIACKNIVFHFNKKHLEDATIPMWVVKTRGTTYYVDHVTANIPWTTKETPNNPSTKGSIKFKEALLKIEDNCAEINPLTWEDKVRLVKANTKRIMFGSLNRDKILKFLQDSEVEHSKCYQHRGSCGTKYYVIEVDYDALTLLALRFAKVFRVLSENEYYHHKMTTGEVYTLDPDYVDNSTYDVTDEDIFEEDEDLD